MVKKKGKKCYWFVDRAMEKSHLGVGFYGIKELSRMRIRKGLKGD